MGVSELQMYYMKMTGRRQQRKHGREEAGTGCSATRPLEKMRTKTMMMMAKTTWTQDWRKRWSGCGEKGGEGRVEGVEVVGHICNS